MPWRHRRAIRAIENCRTEQLGGHIYHCQSCEEVQYRYHSCRNRHCPKCQNEKAGEWLEKQQALLLPAPYFLLTFTLPSELREVTRSNPSVIYNLLFRSSAAATQSLASDPRFVGGQIGMIGVLHTWGRKLNYHPHVHYLVPAVGYDPDQPLSLPAKKNFLLPVKALSKIYRAKFRDELEQTSLFEDIPTEVWQQDWVVHCKAVGNGQTALKYLAPYIFRVAISNTRILKLADGKVSFSCKARDTEKNKTCTLAAEEFIRRFLQHVLPKGFVKVRYYGFFSSGLRSRLEIIRRQLVSLPTGQISSSGEVERETEAHQAGDDPTRREVICPACGEAMQRRQVIRPKGRCPP